MKDGKLILGTVQMGIPYGINNSKGQIELLESFEIFRKAYDSGVKCLDTAEAYGNAHEVIGAFHRSNPDKVFDVITKLPHHIDENLDVKIEKYMTQMHIKTLKGLLFHSYKTYKDNLVSIGLLSRFKFEGKVQSLGVSVYSNAEIEDVMEDNNVDIIQLPFNIFDNSNLRGEVIARAKLKGKQIHTRSAFLQGLFFSSLESENKIVKSLLKELNLIFNISNRFNLSVRKIALNYCLQQKNIDNVLIGVDSLMQLNENLSDADLSLSKEIFNEINTIYINEINLLNPSLWNQ